jgi:monoamine oxidase
VSDVIIVGAGLAGAASAAKLGERGLKVAILEARDRVGGRGYVRDFAGTGETLDFGGAWITPWQHRVRGLCARHGIALRPRAPIVARRYFRDGGLHDTPASAADRLRHDRVIARVAADAILLKKGLGEDEKGRDIAHVSFADYLDRLDPPQATRDLLRAWWCQSGNAAIHEAPAAELLGSSAYSQGLTEAMADVWADTLVGGISALTGKMLSASGARVQQAAPVHAVAVTTEGVTVTTADGAEHRARAVLLATGINPLRNIRFSPPLPAEKAAAIAVGHLGRAVKVWAKVKGVPVGIVACGGGTGIQWMFSERDTTDGATLLVGFGTQADGWTPDLPGDIATAVARFFPEATLLAADWHDWNADPFALGAWTAAKVGAEAATAAATWQAAGPLAFATSDFAPEQAGWFEGAIVSGEAAAAELLSFLRA